MGTGNTGARLAQQVTGVLTSYLEEATAAWAQGGELRLSSRGSSRPQAPPSFSSRRAGDAAQAMRPRVGPQPVHLAGSRPKDTYPSISPEPPFPSDLLEDFCQLVSGLLILLTGTRSSLGRSFGPRHAGRGLAWKRRVYGRVICVLD